MADYKEQILKGIRDKLLSVLPAGSTALLYGSQARGDEHPGSDWDVLIIVEKDKVSLAENATITYPVIMYGWEQGLEINPVLYTRQEWEANKYTPFAENVMRDGLKIA